jgi:hypothetical protein
MALELATEDEEYEDLASKFFEHFIAISSAINNFGGTGLWDELDGFYYDQLELETTTIPLRARSLVGVIPMLVVEILKDSQIRALPGFKKRLDWFIANNPELAKRLEASSRAQSPTQGRQSNDGLGDKLLSIPSTKQLKRLLAYVLDEKEFLSPYGIRSLSRIHAEYPYRLTLENKDYGIDYCPGDSNTDFFGGNSNWRGPVWFPINHLLIEALERYYDFFGESLTVEFPTHSGKFSSLREIALDLKRRHASLFQADDDGKRPCHGTDERYAKDPGWKDLVLFYEFFHGDTGRGHGASHQTGWTSLVSLHLEHLARAKEG